MVPDSTIKLPSDRSFGITFFVVFTLLAAWQAWRGRATIAMIFGGVAVTIFAVALARPTLLHGLNRAWMKFGALLHGVVSPIVLGAIYFLVFTPIGWAMRLAGRDVLSRKLDATLQSYWIQRDPPGPPPDSLPRQF